MMGAVAAPLGARALVVPTSIARRVLRSARWIPCSTLAQAHHQNPAPSLLLISMPLTTMLRRPKRTTPLVAASPICLVLPISALQATPASEMTFQQPKRHHQRAVFYSSILTHRRP